LPILYLQARREHHQSSMGCRGEPVCCAGNDSAYRPEAGPTVSGGALSRADVASHTWHIKGKELELSRRSLVMGVLNITPDSFSDGGEWISADKALEHAAAMIRAGADILDIGAESTRPGRPQTVTLEEEW